MVALLGVVIDIAEVLLLLATCISHRVKGSLLVDCYVLLKVSLYLVVIGSLTENLVIAAADEHASLKAFPSILIGSCSFIDGREDQFGFRRSKAFISNTTIVAVLSCDDVLLV